MTGEEMRAARQRLELRQADMAARLGVSLRLVKYWEQGERPIPRLAALACWALEHGAPV